MKKVKIMIWVIALGFISLVVFQNKDYFFGEQTLQIKMLFVNERTFVVINLFFFLGCFLTGFLIAHFYGFIARFKSRKLIKKLNETTAAQHEEISGLKQELEIIQKNASDIHSSP